MLEEVGIGEPCLNCLFLLYCTMNIQFIRGYSRSERGRPVPQEGPLLPATHPVSGLRRTQSSCCVYASKAAGSSRAGQADLAISLFVHRFMHWGKSIDLEPSHFCESHGSIKVEREYCTETKWIQRSKGYLTHEVLLEHLYGITSNDGVVKGIEDVCHVVSARIRGFNPTLQLAFQQKIWQP